MLSRILRAFTQSPDGLLLASTFDINVARGLMLGDGFRKTVVKITGPSSYVVGGETITAGAFRLGAIEYFPPVALIATTGAASMVHAVYNDVTGKLQYFYGGGVGSGAGGTEFAYSPADLLGATTVTANSSTADQASAPVNSAAIVTKVANSSAAGTLTVAAQPDLGRSVTVTLGNEIGGATTLDLYVGSITFTVTGKFRGAAQTETILFTSTGGNKTVADTKFRFKQGVKPFDSISAITYDHTADFDAATKISVGVGSLIGLPVNRLTPADADVLTFSVTHVPKTIAGAFSDTNKTVEVGTTADAWDLQLIYMVAGGTGEVGVGTDLSGYVGRTLVHGK